MQHYGVFRSVLPETTFVRSPFLSKYGVDLPSSLSVQETKTGRRTARLPRHHGISSSTGDIGHVWFRILSVG